MNKWEKKLLLIKCEVALRLSVDNGKLNNDIDLNYDMIDDLDESLDMSGYEGNVLNDHITFMMAMLGLMNPNRLFISAYQVCFKENCGAF